ncbi:MAG: hypothetical protein GY793_02780 [Proteobacteria bacterium]|nr:hypothetical protein [Pseudomonadota bacterium]
MSIACTRIRTKIIVRKKIFRALLGGFFGALVFMLLGIFHPCEIAEHNLKIVNLVPTLCLECVSCLIIHFAVGTILFPIFYLVVGIKYIMGPPFIKGMIFIIPVFFIVMAVVLISLDSDMLIYNPVKALHILINYMIYGGILGGVTGELVISKL